MSNRNFKPYPNPVEVLTGKDLEEINQRLKRLEEKLMEQSGYDGRLEPTVKTQKGKKDNEQNEKR